MFANSVCSLLAAKMMESSAGLWFLTGNSNQEQLGVGWKESL